MSKDSKTVPSSATTLPVAADFTDDLIRALNKERGAQVAYNLSRDVSPVHVDRWVSTGSRQLDYIVSNRPNGGLPVGRVIEIFGPPSIGKSHLATQIAKSTQLAGGIVVYFDTENAMSVENLELLGVDISERFVYVDTHCTEEFFEIAEATILRAKAATKDVPVTIIWDSVAGTSPKMELEGDYDKDSMGLQARVIAKGMRKITGIISNERVLFVCLNQEKSAVGIVYGDPTFVPGGKAIPYHATTRIRLGAGQQIKTAKGDVVGIHVWSKTIKNKISPPFRKVEFDIIFGVGIREHEQIFDLMREHGPEVIDGHVVHVHGDSAWKDVSVKKAGKVILEKKFNKSKFDEVLEDPKYKHFLDALLERIMVKKVRDEAADVDPTSLVELKAVVDELQVSTAT